MSNLLSAGDDKHEGDILEWIAQEQEDVAEDKFDKIAAPRWMGWTSTRSYEVFKVLVHCAEQSHRWNTASIGEKRKTQRWNERMEKATHGVRTSDKCDGAKILKNSLGIPLEQRQHPA